MSKLVLFIHGLGGNKETWGKFPELISDDNSIDEKEFEFAYYEYGAPLVNAKSALSVVGSIGEFIMIPFAAATTSGLSTLFKDMQDINELARLLHTQLEACYCEHEEIHIVAHGMGGLIAQKYLVDSINQNHEHKVTKLMLYNVPNHGKSFAKISAIYKHKQIKQLAKNSEFISELKRRDEFKQIANTIDTQSIVCFDGSGVNTDLATAGL